MLKIAFSLVTCRSGALRAVGRATRGPGEWKRKSARRTRRTTLLHSSHHFATPRRTTLLHSDPRAIRRLMDVSSLSISELRAIIRDAGLSYDGVVEKSELRLLAQRAVSSSLSQLHSPPPPQQQQQPPPTTTTTTVAVEAAPTRAAPPPPSQADEDDDEDDKPRKQPTRTAGRDNQQFHALPIDEEAAEADVAEEEVGFDYRDHRRARRRIMWRVVCSCVALPLVLSVAVSMSDRRQAAIIERCPELSMPAQLVHVTCAVHAFTHALAPV